MLGTLLGILLALVLAAVVIVIVSKLNLGLTVDGFGPAIIAAAVIAIVGGLIYWLLWASWASPSAVDGWARSST